MPKASFRTADAIEVSLGIQEGWVEVIGAISMIRQYPANKKTGQQSEPFCCVQLEFARTNPAGERNDEDPVKMEFSVGGRTDNSYEIRPGKVDNRDDEDPEDLGDEVDTEGNCLFIEDGYKMNKSVKWLKFVDSLEKLGFKPDILGTGYLPDLVGLKGHVKTIDLPKIPGSTYTKDPTCLVFDKITVFPYEKKSAKSGKSAGKTAAKAETKAEAKSESSSNSSSNGSINVDGEPEEIATQILGLIQKECQGTENMELKTLITRVQTRLIRAKVPVSKHKPITQGLLKDEDWLTNTGAELGFIVDDGKVSFPAD